MQLNLRRQIGIKKRRTFRRFQIQGKNLEKLNLKRVLKIFVCMLGLGIFPETIPTGTYM